YYPFSRFEDEFFQDFFSDFSVSGPQREFKRTGLGSGVIIDKEGHVLTNEHVIQGADKIEVILSDGRKLEAQVTGSDLYSDLAVIKIEPDGDLPFARLGDSDNVQIGQWAIAIGSPFGFSVKNPEPTVTVGVVSALHRSLARTDKRVREYSDLIQTDASINPGNSGGPLLNIYGEIIGINVAIFTLSGGSEGIGFAIPINAAKKIMNDLIEGREVLHGWIGVIIQDIDSDIAKYFNLGDTKGVLISRIVDKSPAELSGLRSGDIIVSFEDTHIRNTHDLIRYVLSKDIGDKVKLSIIRGGVKHSIGVEIGVRPEKGKTRILRARERAEEDVGKIESWRGIEVSNITSELSERYQIKPNSGVIVVNVAAGFSDHTSGIRKGDILYEINRTPVRNVRGYNKAVKETSGDVLVATYRGYVVIRGQ
ncbi:MAG: Do family serine endopeptidase, partial [Candidatus Omnitrophota bacterium]|nr:Do family serine endopeptidase [Candidatus Omnitrophota bacterium]